MNLAFEDHILPEAANVSSVARRDTTSQLQLDAISIVPLVLDASEDPLFPHANITIESSEPAAGIHRIQMLYLCENVRRTALRAVKNNQNETIIRVF